MRSRGCVREDELLDALQTSRWPEACDGSLREHVSTCPACTDLLVVVAPLLGDQRALVHEAAVPSSAIVWWRAQMRSRREAAERAARPITFIQGITLACVAGLLATAMGMFVPTFRRSLAWMADAAGGWSNIQAPVSAEALSNPVVLAGLAAVLLFAIAAPIALYFTLRED